MKTLSVMIPCYNEQENVVPLYEAIKETITKELPEYNYEILFIDNKSKDNTRKLLRELCERDKNVKAVFNMKNFGQFNSPYYGLCQTTGDCTIMMCCDFQDPVELIPTMVHEWEKGHKVVCMIKTSSMENKIMYWMRGVYYKMIKKMSDVEQIQQFTGFGLYDKSFIDVMKQLKDPTPFLRGVVAEYAPDHLEIPYQQQKRMAGKTKNNFFTLFDAAMLSFTSYTKGGLRIATFAGFLLASFSVLVAFVYFVLKLAFWNLFSIGYAPILIGVFFLGGMQLFFIGLLGEYIMSMNERVINRPLVIEEERINFTDSEK
jgi:glycosyltransferase involved in cell wall biosynthesis